MLRHIDMLVRFFTRNTNLKFAASFLAQQTLLARFTNRLRECPLQGTAAEVKTVTLAPGRP